MGVDRKDRVEEYPRIERTEWKNTQEQKGQSGRIPKNRKDRVEECPMIEEKKSLKFMHLTRSQRSKLRSGKDMGHECISLWT